LVSQHDAATSITLLLNALPDFPCLSAINHGGWDEQQTLRQVANDFSGWLHFHIEPWLNVI